jgi:BlaI family penicillinase repressor
MKRVPRISETEWAVMKVVWSKGSGTANDIIEKLHQTDKTWHPKTMKTLLGRLVTKKALDYQKVGRTYVYRSIVSEEECASAATESFLDRVFGGSLQPMLAYFVRRKKLSAADIAELKRILDKR